MQTDRASSRKKTTKTLLKPVTPLCFPYLFNFYPFISVNFSLKSDLGSSIQENIVCRSTDN